MSVLYHTQPAIMRQGTSSSQTTTTKRNNTTRAYLTLLHFCRALGPLGQDQELDELFSFRKCEIQKSVLLLRICH